VVESVGFLAGQGQYLLGPWGKITHGFVAHRGKVISLQLFVQ
jgi:hypothetical protein